MVRTLRWLAVLVFVSLPVIAVLGRDQWLGCNNPLTTPCDQRFLSGHNWMITALGAAVVVGSGILIVAALLALLREESN